jgi:hypothetical protein
MTSLDLKGMKVAIGGGTGGIVRASKELLATQFFASQRARDAEVRDRLSQARCGV